MPGYDNVYALRYNPFNLRGAIPGLPDPLGQDLDTMPLQIARDGRLVAHFCDEIYPAANDFVRSPYEYFVYTMRDRGYGDQPPTLGQSGRVVLIRGAKGTGKTTLAHRMMRWLLNCGPANAWRPLIEWPGGSQSAMEQKSSLEKTFVNQVRDGGNGRFLCLIEDIKDEADVKLFEIYSRLTTATRTLCLIIATDDAGMRNKRFGTSKPSVLICETETLTPERAVNYCAKRFAAARCQNAPAWMAEYPLFPFKKGIIEDCLKPLPGSLQPFDEPGVVAVRELNSKFAELLSQGLLRHTEAYDVRNLAPHEVEGKLMNPVTSKKVA